MRRMVKVYCYNERKRELLVEYEKDGNGDGVTVH